MSNDNLANMILNNYKEFIDYKANNSDIDISETDFSHGYIESADLSNIDFTGSSFQEANLVGVNFIDCDLTSVDFSRANVTECDFSGAILNGAIFNYAMVNYCNFTDCDLAGANFAEADLSDSDFSASENLDSCRFDESTVWPDTDKLPEEFDSSYAYDLSSLREDEEDEPRGEGVY